MTMVGIAFSRIPASACIVCSIMSWEGNAWKLCAEDPAHGPPARSQSFYAITWRGEGATFRRGEDEWAGSLVRVSRATGAAPECYLMECYLRRQRVKATKAPPTANMAIVEGSGVAATLTGIPSALETGLYSDVIGDADITSAPSKEKVPETTSFKGVTSDVEVEASLAALGPWHKYQNLP